jgi:hypothetical protein
MFRGELVTVDNGIAVVAVRNRSYFASLSADETEYEQQFLTIFSQTRRCRFSLENKTYCIVKNVGSFKVH